MWPRVFDVVKEINSHELLTFVEEKFRVARTQYGRMPQHNSKISKDVHEGLIDRRACSDLKYEIIN